MLRDKACNVIKTRCKNKIRCHKKVKFSGRLMSYTSFFIWWHDFGTKDFMFHTKCWYSSIIVAKLLCTAVKWNFSHVLWFSSWKLIWLHSFQPTLFLIPCMHLSWRWIELHGSWCQKAEFYTNKVVNALIFNVPWDKTIDGK